MAVLLVLFYALVIVALIKLSLRPSNFPPGMILIATFDIEFRNQISVKKLIPYNIGCELGPRGVPFLGYAPFLSTKEPLFRVMQKMAKTYGPVTGFYLGPVLAFISVDGQKAVTEALHNNDLNGRPSGSVILSRTFGEKLGALPKVAYKIK